MILKYIRIRMMILMKSYCYSQHELPFIIANLQEGFKHLNKLILYEYNFTHTGMKKDYEIEKVLHLIPEHLKEKLDYKKIDLTPYNEYAYENANIIHTVNEPIQRSWLFNDKDYNLTSDTIIIDNDIDEIIYEDSYPELIKELVRKKCPVSIRLNQFFFKPNYLWSDCNFSSPTVYTYGMVQNINKKIKGLSIKNLRDLGTKTDKIHGCHMSWIMPADYMVKKLHSYSHPEYRKYADKEVLQKAIDNKIYIFDTKRTFNINELNKNNKLIPKYLQQDDIFTYLS